MAGRLLSILSIPKQQHKVAEQVRFSTKVLRLVKPFLEFLLVRLDSEVSRVKDEVVTLRGRVQQTKKNVKQITERLTQYEKKERRLVLEVRFLELLVNKAELLTLEEKRQLGSIIKNIEQIPTERLEAAISYLQSYGGS